MNLPISQSVIKTLTYSPHFYIEKPLSSKIDDVEHHK